MSSHPVTVIGASRRYAKGGHREDIDLYVRSSWEANYARYLNLLKENGEVLGWEYEAQTFSFDRIKRGSRHYTPDFKVTFGDGRVEFHEVKGYMRPDAKTKIKRMAKYHPSAVVLVIDGKRYRAIEKEYKPQIPTWE